MLRSNVMTIGQLSRRSGVPIKVLRDYEDLGFLFLIPWGWGFGVLLYWSVSCLIAACLSHGDCEVVALPSLLLRRHYTVYCPLNAIDLVEHRYMKR